MMSDRRVEPVVTEAASWVTHSFLLLIDYCVARIIFDYCARAIFDYCAFLGLSLCKDHLWRLCLTKVWLAEYLKVLSDLIPDNSIFFSALVKRLGSPSHFWISAIQVRSSPLWTRRALLRCWSSWTTRRRCWTSRTTGWRWNSWSTRRMGWSTRSQRHHYNFNVQELPRCFWRKDCHKPRKSLKSHFIQERFYSLTRLLVGPQGAPDLSNIFHNTNSHCGYHRYFLIKVWAAGAHESALCRREHWPWLKNIKPAPPHICLIF